MKDEIKKYLNVPLFKQCALLCILIFFIQPVKLFSFVLFIQFDLLYVSMNTMLMIYRF